MYQLRFRWNMVLATIVLFFVALSINEWVFTRSEFIRGINWIYLPAGVRLLCTLLFGVSGVAGLLIASWIACFFYYFPDDFIRSAIGGIIAAIAPYLAYLVARHGLNLQKNLGNLTPKRLLVCVVIYALANSTLHHLWFMFNDSKNELLYSFGVMFLGDLSGSLAVLYTMKTSLSLVSRISVRRRMKSTKQISHENCRNVE